MVQSVYDLIERDLGVPVTTRQNAEVTSIGTTAALVFRADPRRIALVFINLSTNAVYFSPSNTVSSSNGITLVASGGSVSQNYREDFSLPAQEWHAVADGASSAVYALEVLIA